MDCRQAQSLAALSVGQDHADPAIERALHQHLGECADCRRFHRQLIVSQAVLVECRVHPASRSRLWPRVAERLAELEQRPQFLRFNVWLPTSAAAAACLLLMTVAMVEVQRRDDAVARPVAARLESRDLFRTDPVFASNRGGLPSDNDLERWRRRLVEDMPGEFNDLEVQPARNPIRGFAEW